MKKLFVLVFLLGMSSLCFTQINLQKKPENPEANSNPVESDGDIVLWETSPLAGTTSSLGKLSLKIPDINNSVTLPNGNIFSIPIPAIQDSVGIRQNNEYIKYKLPKYIEKSVKSIKLNGYTYSVPIINGQETRLKAGFFTIWRKTSTYYEGLQGVGDEALDVYKDINSGGGALYSNSDDEGYNWEWELRIKGFDNVLGKGKKSTTLALPPGEYILKRTDPIKDHSIEYYAKITDGKWVFNGERIQSNTSGNQIKTGDATDKWEITPVATMKGVLGKLNTKFSEDADWSIDIRTAAGNKFITNRSSYSKHGPLQDIAPGTYNFRLNTILVENVPIEKGKETRLKAGYLSIVSEGGWHLYDETQKKLQTSGNKPKKIVLPVGSYQLKLDGQFFPVVIKDKETVEY